MDCRRDAQIYAPRQKVSADFPSILKSEYRLFYKGSFAKETYNFKEPTKSRGRESVKSRLYRHYKSGGLGSRPKKMYGERLGDGVEYHLMSPTPHC